MKIVFRSTSTVAFSQVLADAAATYCPPKPLGCGTDRLIYQLTNLAAVGKLQPVFASRSNDDPPEGVEESTPQDTAAMYCLKMQEASRRLEAMRSSSSLTTAELRRLRREVAMIAHPDLYPDEYKRLAEELMKAFNAMVTSALDRRLRP